MSAPAAAFVAVGQFLARWSTPLLNDDVTQPVLPGSKMPGTSAALAVAAKASASATTAVDISLFMQSPPRLSVAAREFPLALRCVHMVNGRRSRSGADGL